MLKEVENPNLWNDQNKARLVLKEKNYLENNIGKIESITKELQTYLEMIELSEKEQDKEVYSEVLLQLKKLEQLVKKQEVECLFSGELDENGCFLEIHSGAGGTESDDWASILMRMYMRWLERHNFSYEIIDNLLGDEAGIKSVTFKVQGHNAFGWLKTERGVHRLVRVSPFNSAGKRHTSFASVWVYPKIDTNISIEVKESDLRIDTYRSSGAGGQHVNTTDSAVRITHLPTKIVVQCQNDRSQHRNKEECMSMLRSKLYEMEIKKMEDKDDQKNSEKTDIGWGNQIRSYVLHPYKMVKDVRTQWQTSNTSAVLDGDIDEFIHKALMQSVVGKGLKAQ
ncbi:Peptide chain release factor 2 [Candidatus Bandiella woodruffii]|uniref:Peptide chain release factor 2 n=1 Tax=Candidatus Bandiella euplotis TaxID=1664265 RepID=A0ABZ0UPZ2_9RICK|nr:Peptide chain release factor 2 [Candidatus Bandiella woodruffii]